jgi:hypothetical protein
MHVTLLLPGALIPGEIARALTETLEAPALQALLARSGRDETSESDAPPHLEWLAREVFRRAGPVPTAPYAFAALDGAPPPSEAIIWHADPIHLQLARDHLVVTLLPAPPAADEADALIKAANALAADVGATFVRMADRWFLRSERPWSLHLEPLDAVLGAPLYGAKPGGDDAPLWNRLLNEIQMAWHEHPVNEAREIRGLPAINSVWLAGGGAWSELALGYTAVQADTPELHGAALAAGLPFIPTGAPPPEGALVVWSDARVARLTHDWERWLAAMRAIEARIATLPRSAGADIVLTGARTLRSVSSRPSDRLKFWRSQPLEKALSE